MEKSIKIVSTSDIHGELDFNIPSGDILTISGDICPCRGSCNPTVQMFWINNKFLPWCSKLINDEIVNHIIWVCGNHDFCGRKFVNSPGSNFHLALPSNVHYLEDSMVEIEGVKIYGTPWTPTFGNWSYMAAEPVLDNIYAKIPEGLDILLSHGPAKGWNDVILQSYPDGSRCTDNLGSDALRRHVLRTKCAWLLHGHIHSGNHNITKVLTDCEDLTKHINVVNVSLLDEQYEIAYTPHTFSIIK